MVEQDTIKLLRECDAGIKMGVKSIHDVWMKTTMKLGMDDSDNTIADLMTDGCDMGIKSLNRYLNEYKAADEVSKDICKRLIKLEEKLRKQMQEYL